jgi:molybdopterin synthase catalytic subunit
METIRIQLFARFAEVLQTTDWTVTLAPPATVAALRQKLTEAWPELGSLLEVSRFAVNEDFAAEDRLINSRDEIAVIPPVSGGRG